MQEYNAYPYKRLYVIARTYRYPLDVIDILFKHVERNIPTEYIGSIQTLLYGLFVNLNENYDYIFDTENSLKERVGLFINENQYNNSYNGLLARALKGYC
jgi:hypothetical protein